MMEKVIQLKWPDWPALTIQQWLEIDSLAAKVTYKYMKIGKVIGVFVTTRKLRSGDDILPWPVYPIEKIQKHLQLDLNTPVSYECIQDRLAAIWVKNPKVARDEFIKAVEQSLEELINE